MQQFPELNAFNSIFQGEAIDAMHEKQSKYLTASGLFKLGCSSNYLSRLGCTDKESSLLGLAELIGPGMISWLKLTSCQSQNGGWEDRI